MDCIYQIDYFLRYSDAFEKGTVRAFVKAPAGLECRRGELERLCRTKIHEDLKIDRWEKIDVIDVTEAKARPDERHNKGMKNKQFEQFRNEVKQFLGDGLVGEIGPDKGQFAFCTSEPDLGPVRRAKSLDAIEAIKAKYPQLARCPVAPFAVSGKTIYCIAGLDRLPQD